MNYDCNKSSEKLLLTFDITIASDDKTIHPTEFCHSCFNVTARSTEPGTKRSTTNTQLDYFSGHHIQERVLCVNISLRLAKVEGVESPTQVVHQRSASRINLPPSKTVP